MKLIPVLFMLILTLGLVNAADDYNQTGNYNKQYSEISTDRQGIFSSQIDTVNQPTSLTQTRQTPLVTDLDNNNINEIIVIDDSTVRLYQGKELTTVATFALDSYDERGHFITYNIDSDPFTEIIIADSAGEDLYVLEYNGTTFTNQSKMDLSGLTCVSNCHYMVQCQDTEECILIHNERDAAQALGALDVHAVPFDSDEIGNETEISIASVSIDSACFPRIKEITSVDYNTGTDGSGNKEYIFSVMQLTPGASGETMHIFYLQNQGISDSVTVTDQVSQAVSTDLAASPSCSLDTINFLTSPMLMDIDSDPSGLETIFGQMESSDTFKIYSYNSQGNLIDDYPEAFTADGQILSNPMRANVFSETADNVEFCVLGHDEDEQVLDLLCGSEQTGFLEFESVEFKFSTEGTHNISQTFGEYNIIVHASQHSQTLTDIGSTGDLKNAHEIFTSYGVFELTEDTFNGSVFTQFPRQLNPLFLNPFPNAVFIPVDVEQVGQEDILALQSSPDRLVYIDDGFSNSPPSITSLFTNPCINSDWKINTSAQFTLTVEDENTFDTVAARVILYEGDSNELDSNLTAFAVPPASFDIFFPTVNKSISNMNVQVIAQDSQNATAIEEFTISVNQNGIEFGDFSCTQEFEANVTAANESLTTSGFIAEGSADATGIQTATNKLSETTKLGGATLWLILMAIIAFTIISGAVAGSARIGVNPMQGAIAGLISALLVDGILFIVGAINGVFSAGVVFMVALLLVTVIVAIGSRFLLSSQAGTR